MSKQLDAFPELVPPVPVYRIYQRLRTPLNEGYIDEVRYIRIPGPSYRYTALPMLAYITTAEVWDRYGYGKDWTRELLPAGTPEGCPDVTNAWLIQEQPEK